MATENPVEEKSRRRRRRQVEAEAPVEETEIDSDDGGDDDEDGPTVNPRALTAKKGYATPGRRNKLAEQEEERGNIVTRPFTGLRDYLTGVRDELRKVSWPTREELRRLTVIVLIVTLIASLVLGLISLGFTELFRLGLDNPILFVAFFAVVGGLYFAVTRLGRRGEGSRY
jgi:preprotein translocase subunit SecE